MDPGSEAMNVKQAVEAATQHVTDLFAHENISNVGLEEVEFVESAKQWKVTIGFSRPWDYPTQTLATTLLAALSPKRDYKIILISDAEQEVVSVRARPVE